MNFTERFFRPVRRERFPAADIQEDPGVGHDIYCTSWESLRLYLQEYEKAGLHPARYADADEFIAAYLKSD